MTLTFFIKLLSDIAMYMTAAAYIGGGLGFIESRLFVPCLIAAACGALSCLVNAKAKHKWLRFAPLVLLGTLFFFTNGIGEMIIAAVPALYVVFVAAKSLYNVSWYNAVDSFKLMVKIQAGMFIFFLVIGGMERLAYWALPYTVIYLVAAVLSMRCYRHSAAAVEEPRFQLMNVASVSGVLAVALFLFSDAFINGVKAVAGFLYTNLVSPLLMGVAYVFVGIMWVVEKILSKIIDKGDSQISQLEINIVENLNEELASYGEGPAPTSPILIWIVRILLILAAAFIVVMIFRRLMPEGKKQQAQTGGTKGLTDMPLYRRKKQPLLPRTEEEKVRFYYRRGLILARDNGAQLKPNHDSAQLTGLQANVLGDESGAPERLRLLYLPARYGRASAKGDGEKAKNEYKRLKAGIKSRNDDFLGKGQKELPPDTQNESNP